MSALTDAMTAVVAAIKNSQTSVDATHLASIDAGLQALKDHDAAQDTEIADVTAALGVLHDGLVAPAAEPAPAPAPETAAAPEPAQAPSSAA